LQATLFFRSRLKNIIYVNLHELADHILEDQVHFLLFNTPPWIYERAIPLEYHTLNAGFFQHSVTSGTRRAWRTSIHSTPPQTL
jgi:hypothetical protein